MDPVPKLARKYEIEHCSRSSKTINWSADSFQINHVTSMSWHMSPRYGHRILAVAILFWQLSINHIENVLNKRWGLAKTRLRHPSLPFDSLPYPTRSICRRVRTYVRKLGQEVDRIPWVWGSVPRAPRAWEINKHTLTEKFSHKQILLLLEAKFMLNVINYQVKVRWLFIFPHNSFRAFYFFLLII